MTIFKRLPLLAALTAAIMAPAIQAAEALNVMTFNVRTINGPDGPNRWEMRAQLFADTIAHMHPDVIGTQELSQAQGDETVAKLPEYTWFGRDRFGTHKDEHMGIFYRHDRLKVVESGDYWLSDTPDVPGSMTWGNIYPRMVNWALFERLSDGKRFYLMDTHLPYRDNDEEARTRCAQEILARIARLPKDIPVFVTGDFNTGPESEAHRLLTSVLKDARLAASTKEGPEATFHNFTGNPDHRIDWILYRGAKATRVSTVTMSRDGRYPSDHFPVQATFEL
ncbi:endonuclease/exonuclease/phosphatase family metal-dependent hydrolase [Luteibacter sp. Sphag1AF]|uniref:endonuclease/exonuclease/phosphatase family protein n=1 Tax=Luteibacter sp. Sphag1AF TaxID=2587031 RepID=UPI00161247A3|nr:endonuclease/exonuclease/phosphatase family protein [Luteibacter sp. Sphag1AF]MBB3228544.1 endonuclease/exonuclease/phosphatase family metal-dependent hydrolase [Luteibacter sp. Sphag1AF]